MRRWQALGLSCCVGDCHLSNLVVCVWKWGVRYDGLNLVHSLCARTSTWQQLSCLPERRLVSESAPGHARLVCEVGVFSLRWRGPGERGDMQSRRPQKFAPNMIISYAVPGTWYHRTAAHVLLYLVLWRLRIQGLECLGEALLTSLATSLGSTRLIVARALANVRRVGELHSSIVYKVYFDK